MEALRASAAELRAFAHALMAAQEHEQHRLARELHDLFGQNLTALGLHLDILKSQLGESDAPLRARLDACSALLEATSAALERLVSALRPPMLDDYGLVPALQWYGEEFRRRTGVEVKLSVEGDDERLPAATEIALFRVAQEALAHAVRHARPRRIEIALDRSQERAALSIAGDGAGFDCSARAPHSARLGMLAMQERMHAVGGSFALESAPGRGARITVKVPRSAVLGEQGHQRTDPDERE